MRQPKLTIIVIVTVLVGSTIAFCNSSSTNYTIKNDVISYGGSLSCSATNNSIKHILGGISVGESSASNTNIAGPFVGLSDIIINFLTMYLFDPDSGSTSYTNNGTTIVSFEVSGSPFEMRISESSDFSGASWQTYSATSEYSFQTTTEGTKTVYGQLRDTDLATTEIKTSSIILDTTPPTIVISLEGRRAKEGDVISSKPDISGALTDLYIDIASLIISIDDSAVTDGTGTAGRYDTWVPPIVRYAPKTDLAKGLHSLRFYAEDLAGNTSTETLASMEVKSGDPTVVGKPLNYPNPWNPEQGPTYIAYTLSVDSTVSVYVYDMTLAPLWRKTYPMGTEGGMAGYNEVAWNGITDFSEMLDNGIYYFRVVAEIGGSKKVIGKGKIAVLR